MTPQSGFHRMQPHPVFYAVRTSRETPMWRLTIVTIFALQLGRPATAQDLKARGEKVYADQKCSLCHSIVGKGNAKDALDGVGSKLSEADIRAWITDAAGMTTKTGATRKP
jgi:mono/diheme cytochrome c family protein